MELLAEVMQWCLLAQQRSVGEGALNGAMRGAIIGGVIGTVVGTVMWLMKKFRNDPPKK